MILHCIALYYTCGLSKHNAHLLTQTCHFLLQAYCTRIHTALYMYSHRSTQTEALHLLPRGASSCEWSLHYTGGLLHPALYRDGTTIKHTRTAQQVQFACNVNVQKSIDLAIDFGCAEPKSDTCIDGSRTLVRRCGCSCWEAAILSFSNTFNCKGET